MATFGETLKRERELRKITLREVSEATKIGLRYLEALEGDHFDQLPGGLFNKGFIRAYAKFIGLDGEAMVNAYLYDLKSQQKPEPARPRYSGFRIEDTGLDIPPVEKKPGASTKRWAIVGIAAAALLVLAVTFWLLSFKGPSERSGGAATPDAAKTAPEKAQISADGLRPAADGQAAPSAPAPGEESTSGPDAAGTVSTVPGGDSAVPPGIGATEPGGADSSPSAQPGAGAAPGESSIGSVAPSGATPARPASSSPPSLPEGASAAPRPSGGADAAAPPTAPLAKNGSVVEALSLALTASETTWIAVSCDGVVRLNKEILAGDTVRLSCRGRIRLSCGNAGTVTIRIDGNDCLPLGERGKVIHDFIFDRERAAELCPSAQEP